MIQDKSTRFTLFATGILLLALFIIGWALSRTAAARRSSLPPAGPAAAVTEPAGNGAAEGAPVSSNSSGAAGDPAQGGADAATPAPSLPLMADGEPIADLQVLVDVKLVSDPGNDGDTFLVSTPEGNHRFCLYFVDTVETDGGQPEAARDMARYFEFDSEEPLRLLGVEAQEFSLRLLGNSTFRVFTRWEKNPAENAFYSFIMLNDPDKGWTNLAQLLVRYGLARIVPSSQNLPDSLSSAQFQELLVEEEARSRADAHGAWSGKRP